MLAASAVAAMSGLLHDPYALGTGALLVLCVGTVGRVRLAASAVAALALAPAVGAGNESVLRGAPTDALSPSQAGTVPKSGADPDSYLRRLSAYAVARDACFGVFGRYGAACLRVVGCETGYTYSTRARNGQYLGLFQMGAYARGRYGHSWTAYGQARAAFRYFAATGYSWRPWSCKP